MARARRRPRVRGRAYILLVVGNGFATVDARRYAPCPTPRADDVRRGAATVKKGSPWASVVVASISRYYGLQVSERGGHRLQDCVARALGRICGDAAGRAVDIPSRRWSPRSADF